MASGTAVVATPNPGAREVLGDGRYGRLSDEDGLGTALVDLLRDDRRAPDPGRSRAGPFGHL